MSASTTPTEWPCWASATARLVVTLDLPTPPLPDETAITLTLPRHGGLTVGVVGSLAGIACTPCRIRARRVDDGFEHVLATSEAQAGGRAPVQFKPVLPGDYEVWLERMEPEAEPQPVSARVLVTVAPGEMASIDVALLD